MVMACKELVPTVAEAKSGVPSTEPWPVAMYRKNKQTFFYGKELK
jgi:hypothetical protein